MTGKKEMSIIVYIIVWGEVNGKYYLLNLNMLISRLRDLWVKEGDLVVVG